MNLGGGTTFLIIAFLIIFLAVRACRYGAGQRFRMKTARSDSVNRANSSVSGLRFLVSLSDGCWCWLISCFIFFSYFPMTAIAATNIHNMRHFGDTTLKSNNAFPRLLSQFSSCYFRINSYLIFYPFI